MLLDDPTFPGCWVAARPVGVFWMADDAGPDAKIICVPAGDPRWEHVNDLDELPDHLTDEIEHFFEVYKALEPDKYSSVRGWEGAEAAWQEIRGLPAALPWTRTRRNRWHEPALARSRAGNPARHTCPAWWLHAAPPTASRRRRDHRGRRADHRQPGGRRLRAARRQRRVEAGDVIGHVAVAGQDRVPVRSPFAGRLVEVVAWHGERVLHRQRIAWLRVAA